MNAVGPITLFGAYRTDHRATHWARRVYRRWLRDRLRDPLQQQRLKMFWFVWGYWHLYKLRTIPLLSRLALIARFLRIDWRVLHAHTPEEISLVCLALGERAARPGEVMVEAGCWHGGGSAKFSLLCQRLGYHLYVYDSFAGVDRLSAEQIGVGHDYSGEYTASEAVVRRNVRMYGAPERCSFSKGWFADTLATRPISAPVRVAYIDCDLANGTEEVLHGVVAALTPDGRIFSQDYHIAPVRRLREERTFWNCFGREMPTVHQLTRRLAVLSINAVSPGNFRGDPSSQGDVGDTPRLE